MKKTFLLKTMLLLCALVVGGSAWADPVTTATATDGNSYVVAYHANNKYYALPHGTSASVWNATEVTLNGINKVSTSDAANLAWTLTEGTTAGQFYLTYTSGSNTYYLYKNGGTSNTNYNIKGTTTESERHYWEFALNTEGNYYTVQSLKSGTGSTIYLGYTNVGKYGVYTEDKAAQIILLEIGDASTYTASFSVNGVIDPDDNDVVEEGSAITFPSAPSAIAGKNFIGWKKGSAITGVTDEAPEVLTSDNMGNADVTYYAVFANDQPSNGWQKIEDLSTITEGGIYALITPDGHAFDGTISSGHGQATENVFGFTENTTVVSSAPTGTCEITLVAVKNSNNVTVGYKMYNADKGYLYATKAGSGGLAWHDTENDYWSYISSKSNWIYSKDYNNSNAYLRTYNNTFRTYSQASNSEIAFAKKITVHNYSAYCTTIPPLTKTISEFGWATYAPEFAVSFRSGTNAYIIEAADESIALLTQVTNVPAGTPVLLQGAAGTHTMDVVASSDTYVDDNCLHVSDGNAISGNIYVLAKPNNDGDTTYPVGFYLWNGGTLNPGQIYLQLNYSARPFIALPGETSITSVNKNVNENQNVYDLQGRRVAQPTKGLYIVNGKKILIK